MSYNNNNNNNNFSYSNDGRPMANYSAYLSNSSYSSPPGPSYSNPPYNPNIYSQPSYSGSQPPSYYSNPGGYPYVMNSPTYTPSNSYHSSYNPVNFQASYPHLASLYNSGSANLFSPGQFNSGDPRRLEELRQLRIEQEALELKKKEEEIRRRTEDAMRRQMEEEIRLKLEEELRQKREEQLKNKQQLEEEQGSFSEQRQKQIEDERIRRENEIKKLQRELKKKEQLLKLKEEEEVLNRAEEALNREEAELRMEAIKLQEEEEKKRQLFKTRKELEKQKQKSEEEIKREIQQREELFRKREQELAERQKQMELLNLKQQQLFKEQLNLEREKLAKDQETFTEQQKKQQEKFLNESKKKDLELQKYKDQIKRLTLNPKSLSQSNQNSIDQSFEEISPSEITLGEPIGKGSSGEVYSAKLRGKEVAVKKFLVKQLDEETLQSFKFEISIMSKLRHPNIVLFIGACIQPGNYMIITELCAVSLDKLLDKKTLSLKQRMIFAKDAALGMNWLHTRNPRILHLDLKPMNLLVDKNNNIKVSDFGLSQIKMLEGEESNKIIGTPIYMAPEILLEKEFDEKVDVYSFGIMLWELYEQKQPYENEFYSFEELVECVAVSGERPSLSNTIPPTIKYLITQAWDQIPSNRPSFDSIVTGDVFSQIHIEASLSDPEAASFWKQHFLNKEKVSWNEFVQAFTAHFRISKSVLNLYDKKFICWYMLAVQDNFITIDSLNNSMQLFGPFQGTKTLEKLGIMENSYFHGDVSQDQAEKILMPQKKGTWLVIFMYDNPTLHLPCFVICSRHSKQVNYDLVAICNGKLEFRNRKFDSLDQVIHEFSKELKLKYPCPGSKYSKIQK